MSRRTERPLTTALGWRLPWWLLDIGPVAFIFLVGAGALASKHAVGHMTHAVLFLGLVLATGALLVRHRAPLVVLGLMLAIQIALGWGPVVLLPVLLAVFTVAEYTDRWIVIGATAVTAVATIATLVIHHDQITTGPSCRGWSSSAWPWRWPSTCARGPFTSTGSRSVPNGWSASASCCPSRPSEMACADRARLHDVVAHDVSLMVVQAQALTTTGPQEFRPRPWATSPTWGARRCRDAPHARRPAPSERRRAQLEPQPGVRGLPTLIERTRQAGLEATLTIEERRASCRRRGPVGLSHRPERSPMHPSPPCPPGGPPRLSSGRSRSSCSTTARRQQQPGRQRARAGRDPRAHHPVRSANETGRAAYRSSTTCAAHVPPLIRSPKH